MSFDGVFTHSMVHELTETLVSGWISKIHQPYENEVVLVTHAKGKNHKLLLSAHPSYARIQLSTVTYSNPEALPNSVMMSRRFLDGAILKTIQRIENDHVIHFTFSKRDELGDLQNIILIVELMGRHSTIVLVNQSSGKILDAIKHTGIGQNSYRSLLPRATYIKPPKPTGLNPLTASEEEVFMLLSTASELNRRYLQQHFQGLGKDTADELSVRLLAQPGEKMAIWTELWSSATEAVVPTLTVTEKKGYSILIPYQSLVGEQATYATLGELLDASYSGKAERDRVKQQGGELIRKIENELKRN